MAARTPEEIRASIEQNRAELAVSIDKLRGEVVRVSDWRTQLAQRQQPAMIGAAAAGFVLGGGIAALGAIVFGARRRRRALKNG